MKAQSLGYLVLIIFILACNPAQKGGVTINTSGIFAPTLYEIEHQDADGKTLDLGEWVLTDDPKPITVKISNSTRYNYTNLELLFSTANENDAPSISYVPNLIGELEFPGYGGTCSKTLPPGTNCTITLLFSPRDERRYSEILTLKFKNYVDEETHTATLNFLAGTPASLVFTNDTTQYTFGQIIGSSNTPVVERADPQTYTQELEVINAGGLTAKNITIVNSQTCASTLTNLCPTGMGDVYSMNSECPTKLGPGEKCKITISYLPKNQDPASGAVPADIKEINYRSTVNFAFVKDPDGGMGGLNGYFRSVSTNIEARFKVSITSLNFDIPIVAGNRDVRTFRINNLGYREGAILGINVRDSGGAIIAKCIAKASSSYLDCKDNADAALSLAQFPFTLKDRNSCLTLDPSPRKLIDVGNGCIFDFYFQPSVTYLTDKTTDFLNWQPEVIYDSRFKNNETIITTKLFNMSASSLAAAKVHVTQIRFDGNDYSVTGAYPGPWTAELGRMALQSKNFYKRKAMLFTFTNFGSVPATNISLSDAMNRSIPIGGTGVNLGSLSPYFYATAIGADPNCTTIAPTESCSISVQFAPIGMNTNADEDANMFDGIGLDLKKYKGIRLKYNSGAQYTDTNIDNIPDYGQLTAEARLHATLVQKGLLQQLADDTRNIFTVGGGTVWTGDTSETRIYLQNIGTGPIPYIRLMTPPAPISPSNNYDVTIVPTPTYATLGAEHDCLSLVDMDSTYVVSSTATPDTRNPGVNFAALPKEESCVYTIRTKTHDRERKANAYTCGATPTTLEEGIRFFSREAEAAGTTSLWDFCYNRLDIFWTDFIFDYYDGDSSDPAVPSGPAQIYGNRKSIIKATVQVKGRWPGKLVPHSFSPWLTSTMYRPGFTYPALASGQISVTITEKYFYGLLQSFFTVKDDPLQTSPFMQSDESRDFIPSLAAWGSRGSYDYILYVGSFPQNSGNVDFPVTLRNFGGDGLKVTAFSSTVLTGPTSFTTTAAPSIPYTINMNSDLPNVSYRLPTSQAGEHQMRIDYTYLPGSHSDVMNFESSSTPTNSVTANKISRNGTALIVAYVQPTASHPKLDLTVNDFDVVQNDAAPPTVTMVTPSYAASLSWNTSAFTSSHTFDTVKLTAAPTANDVFAKRRFTFTNNTVNTINDFKILYRGDVTTSVQKTLPTTFTTISGESTCAQGQALASGQNCYITIKYQPGTSDTSDSFVMTALYRMGTGQYVMQNTGISLLPRSPGLLTISGKSTESINYKATPVSSSVVRTSYPLDIGNSFILDSMPKTLSYSAATGTYAKFTIINANSTKASLLLAYQKYLSANNLRGYSNGSPAPTSVVPTAGEYRNVGGVDYAPINILKYADSSTRISWEGSRGCLFGDDENNGAIPSHQKGFNNTSTTPCYIIVTFNLNFQYLLKTISNSDGDDMRDNAAELWYFSVNRSSTASFWMHFKGRVLPDQSTAVGGITSITATEAPNVHFTLPKATPNNGAIGNISGLRVLMATSSTALSDPYNTAITTYFDISPYDASNPQYANITTGLTQGQYFYYRIMAIRYDNRFTTTGRFNGLAAGYYLSSLSNLTAPVKILVPPSNHYYFHTEKLLVEKTLNNGQQYYSYSQASSSCSTRPGVSLKDPTSFSRSYQLINISTWNLLLANPSATSYPAMDQISHWMSDPAVSIDAALGALPDFVANQSSQLMTTSSVYYIRDTNNGSNPVNQAMGGVPTTTYSNYHSYIYGPTNYASARCMATLP